MDGDCCSRADRSDPRAHLRLFAASQIVFNVVFFDVVVFVPDCSSGGVNTCTVLPAASFEFRRTVPVSNGMVLLWHHRVVHGVVHPGPH